MNKELRQMIKAGEAQGFTVKITRKGHVAFYKGADWITTFGGTPSDHRSWKNALAYLKRAGFKA